MSRAPIIPQFSRDPSGGLYAEDNSIFRWIDHSYQEHYEHFISSGLYEKLASQNWIIRHEEVATAAPEHDVFKTITPEKIPFISYPYEWCFSQLKDAALLTLAIQREALLYGMSLKDGNAYNVQFLKGKPIFIDTLSFEKAELCGPWKAYRQFCRHFLAPLALMSYKDIRLGGLLRGSLDGIPLELASSILPRRTYLRSGLLTHLHLHSKAERYFASQRRTGATSVGRSGAGLTLFITHLEKTIENLRWTPPESGWVRYYATRAHYSKEAGEKKEAFVVECLKNLRPSVVWDLGANTGELSRVAANCGSDVVSFDSDPGCVEKNYKQVCLNNGMSVLPLTMDLTDPSPSLGWDAKERASLCDRGPADLLLALALVHHLALSNRVPLDSIASGLARFGRAAIVEFVPKNDPAAQTILTGESDDSDYTQANFEAAFSRHFNAEAKVRLPGSGRVLYFFVRHRDA